MRRPEIPFNRPYLIGRELDYIRDAHAEGHLSIDGRFTRLCQERIRTLTGTRSALLTPSCTAALEAAALLGEIRPGDEVILPSYTFVSTANAFVLRGAVPVFVDIRPDTLNLDEKKVEAAITPKTRAIVAVHYAGVACEMDELVRIARERELLLFEDAAQGLLSTYRGRPLGSFGELATLSFHETKNVICGEGGALLVNREDWLERAEVIRHKGTNRKKFFEGQADRYTWVDLGSSFAPGELSAAFLWAQLEEAERITELRRGIWGRYHEAFRSLELRERLRRPRIPEHCGHNAHLYYLILPEGTRERFIAYLGEKGIQCVFHYVPLHSSPAGRKYGRASGRLEHTEDLSARLVRLPIWIGIEDKLERIVTEVCRALDGG